jgi:biotin carboxyl carrier protein
MQRSYRCGAHHVTVGLQRTGPGRFAANVDGQPHEVDAAVVDASTVQMTVDGVQHTVRLARSGDVYHVAIAGNAYVLAAATGAAAAGGDHAPVLAAPQIVAPMPGKILQVLASVGQKVSAGDGLLILEAMKMEHRMVAEAAGVVRAVHVTDGQMVDAGAVLVEIDYDD